MNRKKYQTQVLLLFSLNSLDLFLSGVRQLLVVFQSWRNETKNVSMRREIPGGMEGLMLKLTREKLKYVSNFRNLYYTIYIIHIRQWV